MKSLTELEDVIYATASMADSDILYALAQRCKIAIMSNEHDGSEQMLHDACQAAISVIEYLHHSATYKR